MAKAHHSHLPEFCFYLPLSRRNSLVSRFLSSLEGMVKSSTKGCCRLAHLHRSSGSLGFGDGLVR